MSDGKITVQIDVDGNSKESMWEWVERFLHLAPPLFVLFDFGFRYLWAWRLGEFFSIPRDYFYNNFITEQLIGIITTIVLMIVLFSPLFIKLMIESGNITFQSLFQHNVILLLYSIYSSTLAVFSLIPFMVYVINLFGIKINVAMDILIVVALAIIFGVSIFFYIKNAVKKDNSKNIKENKRRSFFNQKCDKKLHLTLKELSKELCRKLLNILKNFLYPIFLMILILATLIMGIINISRNPIDDKQYEIVEKDSKVFLVVPRTEKESILFEVTFLDEAKEQLAFERGKYIIGDKKDFEKIEYQKFDDVMPIIPNSENHKFIKNGNAPYLEYGGKKVSITKSTKGHSYAECWESSKKDMNMDIIKDFSGNIYLKESSSNDKYQLIKLIIE